MSQAHAIENRARCPQFRKFAAMRKKELIKNGFAPEKAADLSESETLGRARASLDYGIGEALRANLMAIPNDDGTWRFFLVQSKK